MNGQDPSQNLSQQELNELCDQREQRFRQNMNDDLRAKWDQISNILPNDETRPYGIPQGVAAFDIWEHILNYITDPNEVGMLWEMSDIFRELLKRKYIQTKLPEIVMLVLVKRPGYLVPNRTERYEEYEDKIDKFICLSIRLLSRQCKRSAEELFNCLVHEIDLMFTTTAKVEKVTEFLKTNPSATDSFFPGHIKIDEVGVYNGFDDEDYEIVHASFKNAVTRLLGLVGKRIKFFTYVSYLEIPGPIYDRLLEWAGLLPNVKHISLSNPLFNFTDEALPKLAEVAPFPHCPKLKYYHEDRGNMPVPYLQRILEANPGISDLRLNEESMKRERNISLRVFTGLANISVLETNPNTSLIRRIHLPWRLTKLVLFEQDRYQSLGLYSTESLFPFCHQFRDTLQHLEILIDAIYSGGYLQLPNLKIFIWWHNESYANLNFLLHMERLETLHAKLEDGDSFMKNSSLQDKFNRIFRGRGKCSSFKGRDIWDVFCHLRKIRVTQSGWGGGFIEEFI